MFEHKALHGLDDFFNGLSKRKDREVYFYRINGFSGRIQEFLYQYYETAVRCGVVIEGRIPNPTEANLSYYHEMLGADFKMSVGFIAASLKKWLPRMKDHQRESVAASIYDTLDLLRRSGKNENMLRNAYVKFMCWLYYKFERIVNLLGEETIPKILYEGDISNYELLLMEVLSRSGCDILLLQVKGDQNYLKLDPGSKKSLAYIEPGQSPFPTDFSIRKIREGYEEKIRLRQLYGEPPKTANCTNAWITGKGLEDVLTDVRVRGDDTRFFYNCFLRINGVWDKLTYENDLFQLQLQLRASKRNLVVIDSRIPQPDMDEIGAVRRQSYKSKEQMIFALASNLRTAPETELSRLMIKAFADILLEEGKRQDVSLNKLTNQAVYLICWLKRYQKQLFPKWTYPQVACFFFMGGCAQETDALFLRLLARLPADVVIFAPDLNRTCLLADPLLYETGYPDSLAVEHYPVSDVGLRVGTAAYHAERELDSLMYQDSGIYRNMQYGRAATLILNTMYEEISILWDQELKYRPNFSTVDGTVTLPVIFAKVSGVKEGQILPYWHDIKKLITPDTLVIKNGPVMQGTDANPIKPYAAAFWKNGRLSVDKIKAHKCYQYSVLREEMQNHLLEKLKLLIEQKLIKGTFENGTEYTIIATALNLNKQLIRMIQKFDFTKKNPKLIYINTTEKVITLEDSILAAYLNLIGFDVLFFVPTGYQSVEHHFNKKIMEEHRIGEYLYELQIPDFNSLPEDNRQSWRDKLFRRFI